MSEAVLKRSPSNTTVALQLWAIGALAPLYLFISGGVAKNDFAVFWIAGKQVLSGDAANVYSLAATGAYTQLFDLGKATTFPYPPNALFFFLPFALLPYLAAYLAWALATAAFFYWSARSVLPKGFPSALSILTPAALVCLNFGQTGLLFGALWLWAFQGKWAAVALLTFKPHLGLLSILSLKDRSAFLRTIVLTLALIGASVLLFGAQLWPEFVGHGFRHAGQMGVAKRWFFAGVTPAIGYGLAGWIPFAVIGGVLLARNVNVFTAATASFLVSPYGFHYDMPVVSLGFGLLVFRHWNVMPIPHRIPIALGFLSPVVAISGAWWMPPLLSWALWAQVKYNVLGADQSSGSVAQS